MGQSRKKLGWVSGAFGSGDAQTRQACETEADEGTWHGQRRLAREAEPESLELVRTGGARTLQAGERVGGTGFSPATCTHGYRGLRDEACRGGRTFDYPLQLDGHEERIVM